MAAMNASLDEKAWRLGYGPGSLSSLDWMRTGTFCQSIEPVAPAKCAVPMIGRPVPPRTTCATAPGLTTTEAVCEAMEEPGLLEDALSLKTVHSPGGTFSKENFPAESVFVSSPSVRSLT